MAFRLHDNLFTCDLARDLYEIESRWRDPDLGINNISYLATCFATKMESGNFNIGQIKEYIDPQILVEDNPFVIDARLHQPIFKHCLRCGEDKYANMSTEYWINAMKDQPIFSVSPGYCEKCLIVRRTVRDLNYKITQTGD